MKQLLKEWKQFLNEEEEYYHISDATYEDGTLAEDVEFWDDVIEEGASIDDISLTSAVPAIYTWSATTGSAAWDTPASWTPARNTASITDKLNFSQGGTSTVTIPSTGSVGGRVTFSNNTTANFQAATSTATS